MAYDALEICGEICSAVRVLPIHDLMVPLDDLHPNAYDCRHWCQHGPIFEWVNLLFLLIQNNDNDVFVPRRNGKITRTIALEDFKGFERDTVFLETYGDCTKLKQLEACQSKGKSRVRNAFYNAICCKYFQRNWHKTTYRQKPHSGYKPIATRGFGNMKGGRGLSCNVCEAGLGCGMRGGWWLSCSIGQGAYLRC